ncbi:MAG TPA: iron-sulfur cluster repair di-iron protein [Thermoanaerobaculia bacterium]|nr:iron-sulfur cluster repair di-iron protein [Thermoanaerobaculia bacterium]
MNATMDIRERTVGDLAVEMPLSIRVFEAWKIDYCCGGRTPLPDAVATAGRTIDEFIAALEAQAMVPDNAARDWVFETLTTMAGDIVSTYHAYTREELQTLEPLAQKVLGVHGDRRPELKDVLALLYALRDDMLPHMLKEEQILFPYVTQMEEGNAPTPFFATVKNPVRKMMAEHDRVGELLASLRSVTEEYTPPESACFSYRELYRRLSDFEQRTHEHIHIENNLYFPRAVALEDRAGQPAAFVDACGSGCAH